MCCLKWGATAICHYMLKYVLFEFILKNDNFNTEALFHTKSNQLCLVCQCPLYAVMYFLMCENMMCGINVPWFVERSNSS